jgi:hypothetical protein
MITLFVRTTPHCLTVTSFANSLAVTWMWRTRNLICTSENSIAQSLAAERVSSVRTTSSVIQEVTRRKSPMSVGCLDATEPFHAVTTSRSIVRRHIRHTVVVTAMLLPLTRRAPTMIQGFEASYHLMDSRSGFQHLVVPFPNLSLSNHELGHE